MTVLQTILLGIVQGFTEFLPVSSSGHLKLFQSLFNIGTVPIFYDVMLHVGTLVAVFIVLWKDIKGLITHPIKNKLGMLVIATLPAVAFTLIVENLFPDIFADLTSGKYLAFGFYATSIVLVLCEIIARRQEKHKKLLLPQALIMGVMQGAAAITPGLSRSGSTIAGGIFAGVKREQAAKYAFLMSIPAILGGVVFGTKDLIENGLGTINTSFIFLVLIGMLAAILSGYLAIKFMLNLIAKHKLYGFAIYTAAIGTAVLLESLIYGAVFAPPF